jgi:hypothetical protein
VDGHVLGGRVTDAMIGPPVVDLTRFPGWWNGSATSELAKLRAEVRRLQRSNDAKDRDIGRLELRLRGVPAPSPDVLATMRKALEAWRPHT